MKVLDIDQSSRLKTVTYRDQHGRRWDVTLDKDPLAHIGTPVPRFRAPLLIPPEYLKTDGDRPGWFRIDYDAWEAHLVTGEERFAQWAQLCTQYYKTEQEARFAVGDLPTSPEFVRAARAGNRWVLGLPHPEPGKQYGVPDWAAGILDRIGPRPSRPADVAATRRAARAQYADRVEAAPDAEEPEILDPLEPTGRGGFGEFDADAEDDARDDAELGDAFPTDDDLDDGPVDHDADVLDDMLDGDDDPPIAPTGRAAVATPPTRSRGRRGRGG
jgi:hypothetical protein